VSTDEERQQPRSGARDESGEELVDESGRNPTQRRMDEEGESESDAPVDEPWVTREQNLP
jgi:hypothetical protein